MGILQMSIYGGVLVLAVVAVRMAALRFLPKRMLVILWCIVLARLLVPLEIPSRFSVYSFVEGQMATEGGLFSRKSGTSYDREAFGHSGKGGNVTWRQADEEDGIFRQTAQVDGITELPQAGETYGGELSGQARVDDGELLREMGVIEGAGYLVWIIWGTGTAACSLFFLAAYIRSIREFRMSLPVDSDSIAGWEEGLRLGQGFFPWRRQFERGGRGTVSPVKVRVSDRTDVPLTYGIFHPVILLPKEIEQGGTGKPEQLSYVLWHEYMHICHGDCLLKLLAAAAVCIHWFNPLVWVMYVLINRDIELACDESVIWRCGIENRAVYANMLIGMEARKSGLAPFCSHFGRNAEEERIRAVMGIKKKSLGIATLAAGVVLLVSMAFATSAADSTQEQMYLDAGYTRKEYEMLRALQFDGYADMSVSEFQDRVWELTDTEEYVELLERFSQNEYMEAWVDESETASFFFSVVEPLTAERWQKIDFSGGISVSADQTVMPEDVWTDMAVLEYCITLSILDADKLTVGEYVDSRFGMARGMEDIMTAGWSEEELTDLEFMHKKIDDAVERLEGKWDTDCLCMDVGYSFLPIGDNGLSLEGGTGDSEEEIQKEIQEELQEQWDTLLACYKPFGLTYEYDPTSGDCRMYFQGQAVQGIMDEEQDIWITGHAGTGEAIYGEAAKNAIEVYAVYEDGNLVGLRNATGQEQKEWNLLRKKTAADSYNNVQEVREFLPGTEEDYRAIFSLRKPDYKQMTLAEFNKSLLDWGNENFDGYDRIMCDWIWDDFRVGLSAEEKDFITCTVNLSSQENAMYVRSIYKGTQAEDVNLGDTYTKSLLEDGVQYAWSQMYYQFSYHIVDQEKVTVGERDRCVGGMVEAIRKFWDETDIKDILKMDKSDLMKELNGFAEKYSSENIIITVGAEEQIGLECIDERELIQEREQWERG